MNVENADIVWKFWRISGHQGPHKPTDPHYMGSCFNVWIKWENGEITYKPLDDKFLQVTADELDDFAPHGAMHMHDERF